MPIALGRAPARGRGGMVATSQRAASRAGVEVLAAGGNAADAAVAAAAALAVTEPCSCGLGGDAFALYYCAASRRVTALNGSGRAPRALSIDRVRRDGETGDALDPFSPHSVTVPGAVCAWLDLLERHGSLPASQVLSPAIRLADSGFAVGPVTAHFWATGAAAQLSRGPNGDELTAGGRAPAAGERFKNPHVARVLTRIAEGGRDAFYRGPIAEAIAREVGRAGGLLDLDDLAAHRSEWVEPIATDYGAARIWECPPSGQGVIALLALNILSALGRDSLPPPGAAGRAHRVIEALRLAFADGRRYVADPGAADIPLAGLLSPAYAARRATLLDPGRARAEVRAGSPEAFSDTVYLSVIDGDGDACSLIVSNYMGFGTGLVPEGCGFTLQNRGANFSLDPDHPNALAPGKRPYHTIIPALATGAGDGSLLACFGVMGGFMQPQGHVQVALGLFDDRADPQAVLDRPRLCIDPFASGGAVALEEGFGEAARRDLEALGHRVRLVTGWERSLFGRGQIVAPDGGELVGGSDPRADGCALAVEAS